MTIPQRLNTTVGYKIVTALTGLGLFAFLVGHLSGNLLYFAGDDVLNSYATKLQSLGILLWVARLGLLGLIVTHIVMTIRLRIRNNLAATGHYAKRGYQISTPSSRGMIYSGSLILAFVVFHLAHFTFGWINPEAHAVVDEQGRRDVYFMIQAAFGKLGIVAIYLVGLAAIGSHLKHALYSVLRTLGLLRSEQSPKVQALVVLIAVLITAGFLSIPLSIYLNLA